MITDKQRVKKSIAFGALLMALAVLLGAFAAHGLKNNLEPKYFEVFLTGNKYHFYHGFAFLLVCILELILGGSLKFTKILFTMGIVLFSFNCYLYAVTGIKAFAMIVPVGGLCFVFGWLRLSYRILKQ